MGFFSSFLGHAAANAISEANRDTKKHNELCYQLSDYMNELNTYLESIGCTAVYNANYGCVDTGSISIEKNRMDTIRRKIEQYMQLGGKAQFIHDLDEIDDCIEKIKLLKSKDCIERQDEFDGQEMFWVKEELEREEQECIDNLWVKQLVEAKDNEIKTSSIDTDNLKYEFNRLSSELRDSIVLFKCLLWSNDREEHFISVVFGKEKIYIYNIERNKIFYITSVKSNIIIGSESCVVGYETYIAIEINNIKIGVELSWIDNIKEFYSIKSVREKDINQLTGIEFENVCEQLVQRMGFTTETTKASGDGGIDLVAYNSQPLLSGKYIIQCKRYTGSVGEPIIRDLYGVVMSERANKGILMTTGHFTKSAIAFADGKPIELIDGVKMHELLGAYGIEDFCGAFEDEEEDAITPQEIFINNIMIEDDYEKYQNTIQELDVTNDERKRAQFINWLIELTMGEFPEIIDFREKLVIFKEIKQQISKYINGKRVEKSNLLSYLYQMTFVHLCILEGNFNEAQDMFANLMEHEELQFSVQESIEPNHTQILYENLAIFTWLCYTWYDLIQVAILVDDVNYKLYLTSAGLFYGLPILERQRLESTIEEFDLGVRTFGNRAYFADKLAGLRDIETVSYNDDIVLSHMFFMENYGLDSYYKYTYEFGESTDVAPSIHKICLNGNELVIDGIGEIKGISQKTARWKKFPEHII